MTIASSITSAVHWQDSASLQALWNSVTSYNDICSLAASSDFFFDNFKRHPAYTKVLEHVTADLGEEYAEAILCLGTLDLVKEYDRVSLNDVYGNPELHEFAVGVYSPSTLRYAKVVADIVSLFDREVRKRPFSVVEIGVGYGGQCRLLTELLPIDSYFLVDITPALNLAKRYLEGYAVRSKLTFVTLNEVDTLACDLCISNYAFSELSRPLQDVYFDKIVRHAPNGYMIYNHTTKENFGTYTVSRFAEKLSYRKTRIMNEIPLTHPLNKLLVWKDL